MSKTLTFVDLPAAAQLAGMSTRHFRRVIEERHMRIIYFGRRFKILTTDLQAYLAAPKKDSTERTLDGWETRKRNR